MTNKEQLREAINIIAQECFNTAYDHGFWESRNFGEKIALIHSELSEALEQHRVNKWKPDEHINMFPNVLVELADACIRIFDLAKSEGWDIGSAILAKMEYNCGRSRKHGKDY